MGWLKIALALTLTGIVFLTVFAALVWGPLAFAVVGIALVAAGMLVDSPRKKPPNRP